MRFTLTEEHVVLLRAMNVGWQDCETGAPEIDPKRPYGNSSVELDVAEALGWEVDSDDGLTREQRDHAARLHRETEVALQIVLQTGAFVPGEYENRDRFAPYGVTYQRIPASTAPETPSEAPTGERIESWAVQQIAEKIKQAVYEIEALYNTRQQVKAISLDAILTRIFEAPSGTAPETTTGRVHVCGKRGYAAPGEECDLCVAYCEYLAEKDSKESGR